MNTVDFHHECGPDVRPAFTTTQWTLVLSAADGDSGQAAAALEALCRAYWYPLYAFVRRRGYGTHDAQDLTQEFFARLLEKDYLRAVDRRKGKFRSFLLAALEHFLANEWRRNRAQKRGGNVEFISADAEIAEQQYLQVPGPDLPPDQLFQQQWAILLLRQVLSRLQAEFVASQRGALFQELKVFLTGEKREASYNELAEKLGTTVAALKMTVSRMRQRYGQILREEVAQTVATPEEVEDELRVLFSSLSR